MQPAEYRFVVHLDEISNLKDKNFFCDDILITINSRIESAPDKNGVRRPPINDSRWVASVVGCRYALLMTVIRGLRLKWNRIRIHNVYLLAGAWRIVRNILKELEAMGLDDTDVRSQLRADEKLRTRYIVLYEIITMLARMGQQRIANLAAATSK